VSVKLSIAVVGAGPAGLVTAKELVQEGHEAVCFERDSGLGGIFNFRSDPNTVGVWETCRLTSSVLVTSFSDYFPNDDQGEPFQHRQARHQEYLAYLTRYAEQFGVLPRIRFGNEVIDVSPNGGVNGWQVTVRDTNSHETQVHQFDAVAVCSGLHRVPQVPPLPGLERFEGQILHSAHYRDTTSLRGRSAVFVGAGESGGDIIAEASRALDRCYVSLRRGVFVIPRLLNGLPNDYTGTRLLYSLPDFASRRSDPQAQRLKRRLTMALLPLAGARLAFDRCAKYITSRTRPDPPSEDVRCREVESLIMQLRRESGGNQFETFATKTAAFVEAVVDGHCELRGAISAVTQRGVVFVDGSTADVDVIVLCTGFERASAPFISVRIDLEKLYKNCFDPNWRERLAFIGFVRPSIGAIPPLAEMQARWFAQLCSGNVHLPPVAQMQDHIEGEVAARKRYHRLVFHRLPHLVDFSTYLDDVAEMIGCKPRLIDLLRRPKLLYKLYTTAFSGVQYRLRGPHAEPELAARILLHAHSHVRAVRFLDVAAAELARLVGVSRFQPQLTLVGKLRKIGSERIR
jgi:dimethylaniline monooxygenase (N-oxide forming)